MPIKADSRKGIDWKSTVTWLHFYYSSEWAYSTCLVAGRSSYSAPGSISRSWRWMVHIGTDDPLRSPQNVWPSRVRTNSRLWSMCSRGCSDHLVRFYYRSLVLLPVTERFKQITKKEPKADCGEMQINVVDFYGLHIQLTPD